MMRRCLAALVVLLAGCSTDDDPCASEQEALLSLIREHLACEEDADCEILINSCIRTVGDFVAVGSSTPTEDFEQATEDLRECRMEKSDLSSCTATSLVGHNPVAVCSDGVCVAKTAPWNPGTAGNGGQGAASGLD